MSLDEESKNFQQYKQQLKKKQQEYAECGKERSWYECWGQIMAKFDLPEERKQKADRIFMNTLEVELAKLDEDFFGVRDRRAYMRALAKGEERLMHLEREQDGKVK